jgi:hypothetical protein
VAICIGAFSLFHAALLTVFMGISELIVYGTFLYFIPEFSVFATDHYSQLIYAILSKLVYFIIINILTYFFKGKQEQYPGYDKTLFLLGFVPIFSVFIIITLLSICNKTVLPSSLDIMVVISGIFLLFNNFLIFGLVQYNLKKHMEFMNLQLRLQKEYDSAEYYRMLLAQNENQSILMHILN